MVFGIVISMAGAGWDPTITGKGRRVSLCIARRQFVSVMSIIKMHPTTMKLRWQ